MITEEEPTCTYQSYDVSIFDKSISLRGADYSTKIQFHELNQVTRSVDFNETLANKGTKIGEGSFGMVYEFTYRAFFIDDLQFF